MPQNYYSLVTNVGLIKEAKAGQIGANPINLTEIAIGDGNGSYYDPDSAATSLVNELYRTSLTSAVLDTNNPNQLIIEGLIPEEAGPFYIREVGIFDSDGDLFAIGKYPETFKSNYESGSGKRLYIRLVVAFVSIPNVEIILSQNINFSPNFESELNIKLNNINNELNDRLKISQNLSDLNNVDIAKNNLDIAELTGAIIPFSFLDTPNGWLKCNGAAISRITYEKLFKKIGTRYGIGDGINSFNIPDLRGEFIRGFDDGKGIDNGRIFASNQDDLLRSHSHGMRSSGESGSTGNYMAGASYTNRTIQTTTSGGNETRPRNIALNYCIRY